MIPFFFVQTKEQDNTILAVDRADEESEDKKERDVEEEEDKAETEDVEMRESDPTKANKVTFDESQLIRTQTAAIRSTETVFGRNEGATDTGETDTQVWPLT